MVQIVRSGTKGGLIVMQVTGWMVDGKLVLN